MTRNATRVRHALACAALFAALVATAAAGNDKDGDAKHKLPISGTAEKKTITTLSIYPPEIHLKGAADRQGFVVVAGYADGTTSDVTRSVRARIEDGAVAKLTGSVVTPGTDGTTRLVVELPEQSAAAPIDVAAATATKPVSFRLDVMPIFARNGCNQGSCHGSARGQDGFRLSLFGFDPEGDHFRLTRELGTRRINLAQPEQSLVVQKALGNVTHTGGKRFERDSDYFKTLLAWLDAGAPNDPPDVAKPVGVELFPPRAVLEGAGAQQQLTVRATYSDGSDRDVTSLSVFFTSNDTSAAVTKDGQVTAGQRGEAFVMARFATFTVGVPFVVLPAGLDYQKPELVETNYVDTLVDQKLDRLRIVPSGLCTDEEFLRRASLDVAGVAPTREEYERFVADTAPDKRSKLVDDLLGRKEFAELWVMKWAELLQMRTDDNNRVPYKATLLYFHWLEDEIAKNVPFDQVVRELLSASGGTFRNPPTNYYQIERETLKLAENTAQVFLGMRIQCAQCHNHPFDRWTMDDYYGFAAFFARIGRKNGEDPRETIIFDAKGGEVTHPVGGRVMAPKFLGGATPDCGNRDRRAVLADWITSRDNPWFAKNLVNIVWSHFFGKGIIEPVDDARVSNPSANPELLDELAKRFIEYHYDFKRLVKDLCASQTYQRSTRTNPTNELDHRNFAHAEVRRVRAEVLLDVLSQVTETPNKFPGLPKGARAVQIADGNVTNYFLETFGRSSRASVCSCEVKMEPNLSQALHLLNGDATTNRIRDGGVVKRLLAAKKTPPEILEELYVRCLARRPTEAEVNELLAKLPADAAQLEPALEDCFWALLNSKEFAFNH
jgi:uncharacterized protein DUF1549/uncharacterized protein DUF1553